MSDILWLHPSGKKDPSDRPVVKVNYKDDKIKIWYIFPGFKISDTKPNIKWKWKSFVEVKMSGAGFLSIDQEPLLPCLRRFVQIPPGYEVDTENWQCTRHHPKEFKNKLITWSEDSLSNKGEVKFDGTKYDDDSYNPKFEDIVDIVENNRPIYFYMNGYRTILVQVKPLQYNPKKKLLHGYGKIVVTIPLVRKQIRKKERAREYALTDPDQDLKGFGNLLINPNRKFFAPIKTAPSLRRDVQEQRTGPEFLIIYDEKLKAPAKILKNWKQKCGLITETVSIKTVGNRTANIKEFIRSARNKPGSRLRYVLLFGDVGKIPLSQEDGGKNTDHYYYTHKDPGNLECILPWISGGRIPVQKPEDGMLVVNKIIRYEKNPPSDPEYHKRMVLAAFMQDNRDAASGSSSSDGRADRNYIKTMEDIRSHLISQRFKVHRVYVSQYANPSKYRDGTQVPQEVKENTIHQKEAEAATKLLIRYINEGPLIVAHRGHGDSTGWEKPRLKNDDLSTITTDRPAIYFSINCDTGCFQENKIDVFAEKLLKLHGGALALIASTESSWVWRDDSLIKALFDAIWPGLISAFPQTTPNYPIKYHRLGDILNYAKAYLLVKHGCDNDKRTKDQLELYHVIGDPTLEIWANEPYKPELQASTAEDSLYVELSTCPTDAVLTIWHDDKLLKRIKPPSARISIPLTSLTKLINEASRKIEERFCLSICLAAPGCHFVEEQVWL